MPSPAQMKADKPWEKTRKKPVFKNARARRAYQAKVAESRGLAPGTKVQIDGRAPSGPPYIVDPATGCWLWQGRVTAQGYGWVHGQLAHRVVYSFYKASIPPGMVLLHSCDRPPCVNPAHLNPGTQAENMADMHAKGRARPWGKDPKLSEAQRVEVITRYVDGETASALAQEFGITSGYVTAMAGPRRTGGSRSKLSDGQRAAVAAAYRDGRPSADIMEEFGISRSLLSTIHRDVNGGVGREVAPPPSYDVTRMVKLREQGWSHQRIADACGCGKSTVGRLLAQARSEADS